MDWIAFSLYNYYPYTYVAAIEAPRVLDFSAFINKVKWYMYFVLLNLNSALFRFCCRCQELAITTVGEIGM